MEADYINQFIQARNYIHKTIAGKIETFLLCPFNPITKHLASKETENIIREELEELYPDLPERLIPKCRFRIFEDTNEVEVGIQNYYNSEYDLIFLGTSDMGGGEIFDFYYRDSYDPRFDYVFIARYGNESNDYMIGSKTAKAEYYLGEFTPLAIAYGLALQDGFIE